MNKNDDENVMVMWQCYISLAARKRVEEEAAALGMNRSEYMRALLQEKFDRLDKNKKKP